MGDRVQEVYISIYLDERRIKSNGTYPVKLRVFTPRPRKQKLYKLPYEFEKKEFQAIWETIKTRKEHKPLKTKLNAILVHAEEIANNISPFNFDEFERLYFNKVSLEKDVNYYYSKKIDQCMKNKKIGTAKGYGTALKCLLRFHKKETISFNEVTKDWLKQFENFCIDTEQKSKTTVGIYARTLRTIINMAIEDKSFSREQYPFGKNKYRPPSSRKVKKALSSEQLKVLFEGKPENKEQEKAKDFWFFSYLCNGVNTKDILNLKCKDFNGESIKFIRVKTEDTTTEEVEITIYPDQYAIDVLKKYGNINGEPNDFIFNEWNHDQTAEEQFNKARNFNSSINWHFKKYAKANGVKENVSNIWGRHSFSTVSMRSGASIEQISEAMGHTDIKTTLRYFAGFEDKTKKELSSKLLDFKS